MSPPPRPPAPPRPPSRSQQRGLEALGAARTTLIREITQNLSPPAPIPDGVGPIDERHRDNYNSFVLLVRNHAREHPGAFPQNHPNSALITKLLTPGSHLLPQEIQQLATEMVNNQTLGGVSTSDIEYTDANGQRVSATQLFRLNAPRAIGRSVAEETGDLPFLGGATLMQAIRGFFSWLMNGFQNGFSGPGLMETIAETTAGDITRRLRPRLQAEGYDAATIDRMVNDTHDAVMGANNPNYTPPADRPNPTPPATVGPPAMAGMRRQVEAAIRPQVRAALTPPTVDGIGSFIEAVTDSRTLLRLIPNENRTALENMLTRELTEATINNETPAQINQRLQNAINQDRGDNGSNSLGLRGIPGLDTPLLGGNTALQAFTQRITEQYQQSMRGPGGTNLSAANLGNILPQTLRNAALSVGTATMGLR